MAKVIQITIDYRANVSALDRASIAMQIEQKLDLGVDWVQLSSAAWLVYTTSSVQKWQDRLLPIVRQHNLYVFIVKIDLGSRRGWLPKGVWEWINKMGSKIDE